MGDVRAMIYERDVSTILQLTISELRFVYIISRARQCINCYLATLVAMSVEDYLRFEYILEIGIMTKRINNILQNSQNIYFHSRHNLMIQRNMLPTGKVFEKVKHSSIIFGCSNGSAYELRQKVICVKFPDHAL